jgi:hypothetical protein
MKNVGRKDFNKAEEKGYKVIRSNIKNRTGAACNAYLERFPRFKRK